MISSTSVELIKILFLFSLNKCISTKTHITAVEKQRYTINQMLNAFFYCSVRKIQKSILSEFFALEIILNLDYIGYIHGVEILFMIMPHYSWLHYLNNKFQYIYTVYSLYTCKKKTISTSLG